MQVIDLGLYTFFNPVIKLKASDMILVTLCPLTSLGITKFPVTVLSQERIVAVLSEKRLYVSPLSSVYSPSYPQ